MPAKASPHTRELCSIQEAARRYGVHRDTILRRISSGQLTAYRFGPRLVRVDVAELEGLLKPIVRNGGDAA